MKPWSADNSNSPGGPPASRPTVLGPILPVFLLTLCVAVGDFVAQLFGTGLAWLFFAVGALGGLAVSAFLAFGALARVESWQRGIEFLSGIREPWRAMTVRARSSAAVQDRFIRRIWVCMVAAVYLVPALYLLAVFAGFSIPIPTSLLRPFSADPAPTISPAPVLPAPAPTPGPSAIAQLDRARLRAEIEARGWVLGDVRGTELGAVLQVEGRTAAGELAVILVRLMPERETPPCELGARRAVGVGFSGTPAPELLPALQAEPTLTRDSVVAVLGRHGFAVPAGPAAPNPLGGYQVVWVHGTRAADSVQLRAHAWTSAEAAAQQGADVLIVDLAEGVPPSLGDEILRSLLPGYSPAP